MRTVSKNVYQYNELSDSAKAKARDWFSQFVFSDSNDWEHVIEDAVTIGALIGITIAYDKVQFSGFSSQGDGASFIGSYQYARGGVKAVSDYTGGDTKLVRIAQTLQDVQKKHFYRLVADCSVSGRYSHSGCMDVTVRDSSDDYRDIGEAEDIVTEALRSFADWIYSMLNKEYDYQMSDEAVAENIEANEYEFNEDGSKA